MSHSSLVGKAIRWQISDREIRGTALVLAATKRREGTTFKLLEARGKVREIWLTEGEYEVLT